MGVNRSPRAIASLTIRFGLVAIPVKLYSATESTSAIRFRLMGRGGTPVRQQYVAAPEPDFAPEAAEDEAAPAVAVARPAPAPPPAPAVRASTRAKAAAPAAPEPPAPDEADDDADAPPARSGPVERHEMVKAYEFEKGRFVVFTPAELKALQAAASESIDIVSFIPEGAVDPVHYDKAYLLAPDRRGERPYALLMEALRRSGRCALARWTWRGRQLVVQIRAGDGGLVLQQLFYADEVRSPRDLRIEPVAVSEAELDLALKLVAQSAEDAFDPARFVDEEKQRLLAAVERKIAGREVIAAAAPAERAPVGAQVIDLMEALRASLAKPQPAAPRKPARGAARQAPAAAPAGTARKTARR